jgi:hypothetical protein
MSENESRQEELPPTEVTLAVVALTYLLTQSLTAVAAMVFGLTLLTLVPRLARDREDRRLLAAIILGAFLGYLAADWLSEGRSVRTPYGTYFVGPGLIGAFIGALVGAGVAFAIWLLAGGATLGRKLVRRAPDELGPNWGWWVFFLLWGTAWISSLFTPRGWEAVRRQWAVALWVGVPGFGALALAIWRIAAYRRRRVQKKAQDATAGGEEAKPGEDEDSLTRFDAASVVKYLQKRIPAWTKYPRDTKGLCEIVCWHGEGELQDWYGGTLKDILTRAGDSPLQLPKLAEFLHLVGDEQISAFIEYEPGKTTLTTQPAATDGQFIPRIALAKLVQWEGTFLEEGERLTQMENTLRDVERLWRREDLFVLWQLLRSVTPSALVRREERRNGLARAQSEFAEALDERSPGLGVAYRQSRDTFHTVKMVIASGKDAFRFTLNLYPEYDPTRLFEALTYSSHNPYLSRWGDLSLRLWASWADDWTDPAHEDWVAKWLHGNPWEWEFAYELETGRPAPNYRLRP